MINLLISRLMPLWVVLLAFIAIVRPDPFLVLQPVVEYSLGFVIFLAGLTLHLKRLEIFLKNPALPLAGIFGKWTITFITSVILAKLFFHNDPQLAAGVIITGVVPSGTAANLFSLIGGGDVALSISMSALDTLIGPILTPVLARWGMGYSLMFELWPFIRQMVKIVLIPLLAGIMLQFFVYRFLDGVKKIAPLLSSAALYILVLGVVSKASPSILENKQILFPLFIVAILQVLLPMITGYMYARLLRMDEQGCRSVLFEVGIPNAALAAVLASTNIGPLAGLVAVVNMVCNLTLGAAAASLLMLKSGPCKEA